MPRHNLFHCNSKTNAGEAAVLVADRLSCQQFSHIKIKAKAYEDVRVKIGLDGNECLIIGCIYRHPLHIISDALKNIL